MTRLVATIVIGLLGFAAASSAQEPTSRAEAWRQERAAKAQALHPYQPSGLERAVLRLENEYLPRLFIARTGFYPRLGPFTSGGGFAAGPGYRALGVFGGRADFSVSAALSYRSYWIVESMLRAPRLAGGRAYASAYARHTSFPQEDFYGLGPASSRVDRVDFGLSQTSVGVDAGVRPAPWLRVGGQLDVLAPDLGRGHDDKFPDITARFDEQSAPGLDHQPGFVRVGGYALIDYARPINARQGGRYAASLHRYIDTDGGAYTFSRMDVDLQHYVPAFNERRVLVFRALGSFADAAAEATVPFYLLDSLGGSHTLRGFRQFRFRDRSQLLLQAEYRFEILTALDGALFYDTGQVAPRVRALSLADFERDYGIGLRVGTANGVLIRFDVAFGSGEGTKYWLRFNHAF